MADIVIVTEKCYLVCQAINYITINNADDGEPCVELRTVSRSRKRRGLSKKAAKNKKLQEKQNSKMYQIIINFVPLQQASQQSHRNSDENMTVGINVKGLENCITLFSDMITQMREQLPDKLWVDTLVERLLNNELSKEAK